KKIRNLFILKNSLQGKTAPTGLKHIKPVTFSSRVINTQKERDKIIFEIVKETGCKTSQLKTIKKSNLEGKFLHLRNCSFKLSDTLLDRLKKYCKTKEKNELIFKNKNNKPLSERRIQQIFSAFAGITPQQARKEYACRQYAMGKKRNEIKKELGLKRLDAFNYGLVKI
ncbi:MAG: tyrosine-type recombinase/integrase, partial [Nanoarchaeota archaeon]